MKKIYLPIAVCAIAAMLWGCGEKKEVAPNPDQSFEKVKSAGVLVLGHMGVFPPMIQYDKDRARIRSRPRSMPSWRVFLRRT